MGITPFSTLIQHNKWGMYLRATESQHPTRQAAKGLIGRAARQMGDTSIPYTVASLKMDNKKELHTLLGSVIEFLDTKDQTTHQSGAQPSLVDTLIILTNPNTKVQ
jgi:hypothetical protein